MVHVVKSTKIGAYPTAVVRRTFSKQELERLSQVYFIPKTKNRGRTAMMGTNHVVNNKNDMM